MYANRYTRARLSASYLLWSFEESRIALLSHYVYLSPHARTDLCRYAGASRGSGWSGLCVVHQHVDQKRHTRPLICTMQVRRGRVIPAAIRRRCTTPVTAPAIPGRDTITPPLPVNESWIPSRATEIQQALIQAHYLNGSPTGQWDADTQAAMVKFQSDNGWQTKITPDSRALIKLGLGPKQDAGEYAARPAGISEMSGGASAPNGSADGYDPHHGDLRNSHGQPQQLSAGDTFKQHAL